VGNLIKATNESKLTAVFRQYGKCEVELKGPYAFIEYEEPDDAKEALQDLNKTNLKGANGMARARIEFAKKKRGKGKLEENDISIGEYEDVFSDHSEEGSRKNILNINSIIPIPIQTPSEKVRERSRSRKRDTKENKNKERQLDDISKDDENLNPNLNNLNASSTSSKKRNVCFVCKLPGHFAKECVLTKESCYECGEKGHIAKECHAGVREAKILTENRVKAILSQQSAFKYISPIMKIKNIVNHLKSESRQKDYEMDSQFNHEHIEMKF
jgi:hypothetical protein